MVRFDIIGLDGAILCALIGAIVLTSFRLMPRIWLRDLPEDIQNMAPAISPAEIRIANRIGLAVVGILLVGLIASTLRVGFENGFWLAALHAYLVFQLFNLFDLVVLDWGILLAIDPENPPIEGTERADGWSDYGFHARKSLKGVFVGVPSAGSAAGLA
ncbi:MAG: hypothetical protein AAFX98_05985 [Pseudomonadota bacterium]